MYLHPYTIRKTKTILLVSASITLSACLGTVAHTPERVSLCQVDASNGWKGVRSGVGEHDMSLMIEGVQYLFRISDARLPDKTANPVPDVFWVNLSGYTFGRLAGRRAPPMLYDPSEAVIEVGGKQVKALPRAWMSGPGPVKGQSYPAMEVNVPFNLNVSDGAFSTSFYIAFPIRTPGTTEQYIIAPGTALLDGIRTLLPTLRSCYTPEKTWWHPIH